MLTSISFDNKARDFHLVGFVNDKNISTIMEKIVEINSFDDLKEKEIANYIREPINLYVTTFGGSVYYGMGLMGQIQTSKTKIKTIGLGTVMSMGLYIFLSGHERIAHNMTTFMYHEISTVVWDKIKGIKEELAEVQRLQNILDDYLLKNSIVTKEKIDEIKEGKKEWYIPALEAQKFGIVQSII